MTSFVVNSDQTSSGLTLSAGERGIVFSGGTADATNVSGTILQVSSGGMVAKSQAGIGSSG